MRASKSKQQAHFRQWLIGAFQAAGDPERAVGQQAYMKSLLPFYGVRVPEVRKITRLAARKFKFDNPEPWEATIRLLWQQATRREERTAAVELLLTPEYHKWLTPERIELVEELVVSGAWWDFVDAIAGKGVGVMLREYPVKTKQIMRRWSVDDNIWKRRTAILCQLHRKKNTDRQLLFEIIEPSLGHPEFFLRKAIGWALREYSKVEPEIVADYVGRQADRLAPLSSREALKFIKSG